MTENKKPRDLIHMALGACVSIVALYLYVFLTAELPKDGHKLLEVLGRPPIYIFHFTIPGIIIGISICKYRRATNKMERNSENH